MHQIEARYELFSDSQNGDVVFETALKEHASVNEETAEGSLARFGAVEHVLAAFKNDLGDSAKLTEENRQHVWALIYADLFGEDHL